jgi:hypothetical protein
MARAAAIPRRRGGAGRWLNVIIAGGIVASVAFATHGRFPLLHLSHQAARAGTTTAAQVPPAGGQPWSVFARGTAAAVTWARDLLSAASLPESGADERFVYDWELSEGAGGDDNPLNQGPVPGHPELTSSGPQYGGGAADYVSWAAGIQGSADYLRMPAYAGLLAALARSDYAAACQELFDSPWALSHYGYGSRWDAAALPGST